MNVNENLEEIQKLDPFGEKWDFAADDAAKKAESEKIAGQYNALTKAGIGTSGGVTSGSGDDSRKKWAYQDKDRWGLPKECIVQPLGSRGRTMYFLNDGYEFIECKDTELGSAFIVKLFGEQCERLWEFFPKFDKDGEIKTYTTDYDATRARNALVRACALKNKEYGLFNPTHRLRANGAWIDDDGNLIYNYGDEVVKVVGHREEHYAPGNIGAYVYARGETLRKPAPIECDDWTSVQRFYADLKTWNWVEPFAAKLFLGWVAESFVGGALDWRGVIWINGDAATGKSTLTEEVLSGLFGDGLLTTANYTEAAVRQTVGASHLPVALDELEPGANIQKQIALVELARQAASGSKGFRGGQDHNAVQFELKSCFAFSSINLPPLKVQDRQRIAILNLRTLTNDEKPDTSPARLRKVGAIIQRRMLNGWGKLKEIIEEYREEFSKYTGDSRVVKVYGTMLACADLVLTGDFDFEESADTVEKIWKYVDQVKQEGGTNSSKCVEWLLSFTVREYSGGTMTTIGDLIEQALAPTDNDFARKALMRHGMKIVEEKHDLIENNIGLKNVKMQWLFVANSHQALCNIFQNTDWVGVAGATGGWIGALSNLEGAQKSTKNVRCGGWSGRGILIPVQSLKFNTNEEMM